MCHATFHTKRACLLVLNVSAIAACLHAGDIPQQIEQTVRRAQDVTWHSVGLSGGGGMFSPAISPADPNLMMLNCDMSAAYISKDGGHNWRMIHHAQLRSDTRCRPAFHPTDRKVIFASSSGQLRVSRDGGETFQAIGDLHESLAGEIAICPTQPRLMLAGTRNEHCYISRDGSSTWSRCKGPRGNVIGFHFDSTRGGKVIFAATDQAVWRSDDQGHTWLRKTTGLPSTDVQGFAGGSNVATGQVVLYCTITSTLGNGQLRGGVFRSLDRAESWQPAMGTGINVETHKADRWAYGDIAQYKQILTTDARPMTVYVLNTSTGFHPPHHDTVYRSNDGGNSWRDTYFMDPRFKQYNVALNYVTASTNQSWKSGGVPFGVAICNSDPDRIIMVRGDVNITDDGGKSWFNGHTRPAARQKPGQELGQKPGPGSAWENTGVVVTTTWHYYVDPFQRNRHYIAYTDIGFARSLDAGRTWIWWDPHSWAPWRNTCYEIAFDPEIPGKMWGAFSDVHDIPNDNIISERHGHDRPGGVCISRDFGATWHAEAKGLPPRPITSIVVDPRSPKNRRTLYAAVFMNGIYKSIDDGTTWKSISQGFGSPSNMRAYRVILHRDGTLLASVCAKRPGPGKPLIQEGVGVYRSSDGGQSWHKINRSHPFLYLKDISPHPDNSHMILAGTCDASWQDHGGGLYLTSDGGSSWQRIGRQGRQTFGGYFHPKFPGWIYMTLTEGSTGAGLWLSRDQGQTWQPFSGLPFSNIQRVTFDPKDLAVIYVTTFGGSVWKGPVVPH